MSETPPVIVIAGPTGVGKTAAAVRLAEIFGGEIVGADSMQIYRGMTIGTAKPAPDERARIPHHLIDIIDPDTPFDAARYAAMGRECIRRLLGKGVLPFVVGGTGLYIKALIRGIFEMDVVDPAIRARIRAEAHENGAAALHRRLMERDPETGKRIHPHDICRIIRALEVMEASGASISSFQEAHAFADCPFRTLFFGLILERRRLYERINVRVDAMIRAGLLAEVRNLLEQGYGSSLKSMQSLGYRHMADYLEGRMGWDDAVETLKRDTRRYAKRQLTWFRKVPDILWKSPDDTDDMERTIKNFLKPEGF